MLLHWTISENSCSRLG